MGVLPPHCGQLLTADHCPVGFLSLTLQGIQPIYELTGHVKKDVYYGILCSPVKN